MKKSVNIEVTEKFTFEGFKPAKPKLYKGINKLVKQLDDSILLFVDEECVANIDSFYYSMKIV